MRLKLPTQPPDSKEDLGGFSPPDVTSRQWWTCAVSQPLNTREQKRLHSLVRNEPPPRRALRVRHTQKVPCPSPARAQHQVLSLPSLLGLWVSNTQRKEETDVPRDSPLCSCTNLPVFSQCLRLGSSPGSHSWSSDAVPLG